MSRLPGTEREIDETTLNQVVDFAIEEAEAGRLPFVSTIVLSNGQRTAITPNRVQERADPTAHAEVEAIRDAAFELGIEALAGAVLYTSCSPCVLCYVSCFYAGIRLVVYTVTREEAGHYGCDLRGTYERFPYENGEGWGPDTEFANSDRRLIPFRIWSGEIDAAAFTQGSRGHG